MMGIGHESDKHSCVFMTGMCLELLACVSLTFWIVLILLGALLQLGNLGLFLFHFPLPPKGWLPSSDKHIFLLLGHFGCTDLVDFGDAFSLAAYFLHRL